MTAAPRVHPFELMFGDFRAKRFPAIRDALAGNSDLDRFMLDGAALELLRDLRPDEGLGEGVDDFVALVHAAYLFWRDGEQTVRFDEAATRDLCGPGQDVGTEPRLPAGARYIQIAPRLVWGQLSEGEPFEPLDGWFAGPVLADLRIVGCFGVHEQRPGASIAVVTGRPPAALARPDGASLFAPTMSGGDAAHLHAVTSPDELLLLGWRAIGRERGEDSR